MFDDEDWIMRPVLAGCCKYESLLSTDYDLEDFSRMNAALDVKEENERRRQEAKERRDGPG